MPTRDEIIDIPVDGGHIAGTLVTRTRAIPGVLLVHGWGGSQAQYLARAREIAALGCVCLTFDLRGHAATRTQQDTVSREHNLHDVLAAYDVLAAHRLVDPAAIAVVGSSYGGYLAAILTALRPVCWLALRVPALYLDTQWEQPKSRLRQDQDLATWRQTFVAAQDNRALRACAKFAGDVLLVESELDRIVPHAVLASYREACVHARSLTYRVLAGADHGLSQPEHQQAYTALLVSWVREMVFAAREMAAVPRLGAAAAEAVPAATPGTLPRKG